MCFFCHSWLKGCKIMRESRTACCKICDTPGEKYSYVSCTVKLGVCAKAEHENSFRLKWALFQAIQGALRHHHARRPFTRARPTRRCGAGERLVIPDEQRRNFFKGAVFGLGTRDELLKS
jgi:hypothetical protein